MEIKYTPNNLVGKHLHSDSKSYMDNLKRFLETFKTSPCNLDGMHNENICFGWHRQADKRRNPYDGHTFLYKPEYYSKSDNQDFFQSQKCRNEIQRTYHPINYKLEQCNAYYECQLGFICPYLHAEDKPHFQYGEFFRFDLVTFKSKLCSRLEPHQKKICLDYHNEGDKRRQNVSKYNHVLCNNPRNCNQSCIYSHNKIQQLYHPSRYKSKFCQTYHNKNLQCQYRDFCSFAHTQSEITIQIIHLDNPDNDFYIYLYKTVWCPFIHNHERSKCVYAHNFQDYRRNPHQYKYKPEKCQLWNFKSDQIKCIEQAGCKNGMNCDKCHGWMEHKFHPQLYKKNKNARKQESQGSQIIIRKLQSQDKIKSSLNQKKFAGIYPVGSPFFQQKREISETSRRTKAKTANISSDTSNDGNSNRDDNIKSEKQIQDLKNSLLVFQDEALWKDVVESTIKEDQFRAKSLGKQKKNAHYYDIDYSKSIEDMLQQTSILSKLKNKRINEVKVINMNKQEIANLKFLSQRQKQILARKVQEYNLKRDPKSIQYSSQLTRFFVRKKCEQILQKMKNKKVKQDKLLNLVSKEIQQLSFLLPQQKISLPKILKQFTNDREFTDINRLINGLIKESTQKNQPT